MSASKWPRIKWNQANARLANAPFENLFVEQERTMSEVKSIGVSGDEAAEEKRDDLARKLRTYLERMPAEWRRLFLEQFQRISSAELVQLREKASEYDRIADLIDPYRAYDKSIYDQIVDLMHDDTSREYRAA